MACLSKASHAILETRPAGDCGVFQEGLGFNMISRRIWLGSLCLSLLAGCAQVPTAQLSAARFGYGQEVAESWKRQALMNVVRLRYNDAPAFLDVAAVVTSDSLSTRIQAGATAANTPADSKLDFGAGGTWTSAPTVTFSPIGGERFSKRLLEPLPPTSVLLLVQAGWPIELVWPTTVTTVNGLQGSLMGAPADPQFVALQEVLARMQRSHAVGFRVRQEEGREGIFMVLHRATVPQAVEDLRTLRELLGLNPSANQFTLTQGELPRNDRELAINTRSMFELMQEMGLGVDIPPEHLRKARRVSAPVRQSVDGSPLPPYQPMVRIHSGQAAPKDAYTAIQYKDFWFWIDDEDEQTKRLFTFLMILFSLSETSPPMNAPVLSISPAR